MESIGGVPHKNVCVGFLFSWGCCHNIFGSETTYTELIKDLKNTLLGNLEPHSEG